MVLGLSLEAFTFPFRHLRRFASVLMAGGLVAIAAPPVMASAVDRLYVIDCGRNDTVDQSRWSASVNVGKPLINAIGTATRAKKLSASLAELGVKPDHIRYVAVLHTHGDHVGNVDLFPTASLLIQKPEVEWAFAIGKTPPFKADRPMRCPAMRRTSSTTGTTGGSPR